VYLPLVMNSYVPGKNLVVKSVLVTPGNPAVTAVVVQNTGGWATTETFGVSLYLDPPNPSSIGVNKLWYDVNCANGVIWEVSQTMQPGQTLTLTTATAAPAPYTRWPVSFSAGTHSLYALVDAWGTGIGLVQETNESDNIRGPVTFVR
jgi:hypothetical protein